MCGHHFLDTYFDDLEAYFDLVNNVQFESRYNISPQANVLTIFRGDESYELAEMQWGMIPDWRNQTNSSGHLLMPEVKRSGRSHHFGI